MAMFMHLAAENNLESIRRVGIRPETIHFPELPEGIFCMPVIKDFYATHQWVRELMRFGLRNPCAVYFHLPKDETVWFGRYNDRHIKATASKAVAAFLKSKDRMGFQVILPRKVLPQEIRRTRLVPPLGWRFYPAAKGKKPCLCPACIGRGEYGSHRMLEQKLEKHYHAFRHAESTAQKCTALQEMAALIENHRLEFNCWQELMQDETLHNSSLFAEVGRLVTALKNKKALKIMENYLEGHSPETQKIFAWQVLAGFSDQGEALLAPVCHLPIVKEQIEDFNRDSFERIDG